MTGAAPVTSTTSVTGTSGPVPPARAARALAIAAAADSVGSGLFASSATVFFVSQGVVTGAQAALAATVAGVTALSLQAWAGRFADRVDVPRGYAVVTVLRAIAYLGFVAVGGFAGYLALLVAAVATDRIASPLFQLLVAQYVPDERRVATMARVRTYRNVGLAAGFAAAALVLAVGADAVRWAFAANAASFLGLAAVALWLRRSGPGRSTRRPAAAPGQAPRGPAPSRDGRYVTFTSANAILSLHDAVLFVGIPIWLVERTDLDLSIVPLTLVLNAALTVAAQTVLTRVLARGLALRSLLVPAGVLLVVACGCMAFVTRDAPTGAATALLAVAVVALSIAENVQAVVGWELSFELAPVDERARYVATFNVGVSAQKALGGGAVTGLLLSTGPAGWGLLAAAFAGAALVVRHTARPTHPEVLCTS